MKPYGIIPAVVTPFTEEEELNERVLREILEHFIEVGVQGVFTVGTAGEFWALSVEEKKRIFEITVEVAGGRVATYGGTCANTTREAIQLTRIAKEAGMNFVSILTPSFIQPSQQELYEHYQAIAEAVDIPILLYSNPDRTGNALNTATVARLAKECENIVGIKDSSGNFTQSLDYIRECPSDFSLIMGRDTMILAALMHGAAGAIAATANIAPELAVGIYEDFRAGRIDSALEKQRKLHPVRQAFSLGSHPAPLKAGMEIRGYPVGTPRAPISRLGPEGQKKLRELLETLELVPAEVRGK